LADDAHRSRSSHSHPVGNGRQHQEREVGNDILYGNRYAYFKEHPESFRVEPEGSGPEIEFEPAALQVDYTCYHANGLRDDRGYSRARGLHSQPAHKQKVEDDIYTAGYRDKNQRPFAVAQPSQYGRKSIVSENEYRSGKGYVQVFPGLLICLRRSLHEMEDSIRQQQHRSRQYYCRSQQESEQRPDGFTHPLPVAG